MLTHFVCVTGLGSAREATHLARVAREAGVGFVGGVLHEAGSFPARRRHAPVAAVPGIVEALHAEGAEAALHVHASDVPGLVARVGALGVGFDRVQVNVRSSLAFAAANTVRDVLPGVSLILSLPGSAGRWPADRLAAFRAAVGDGAVLVDPSGGRGRLLEEAVLDAASRGLAALGWSGTVIVAGGLCAANVAGVVVAARDRLGRVSVDAEGRLRDADDALDLAAAAAYVAAAAAAVS